MTEAEFALWSTRILIGLLVGLMLMIVLKLAIQSKAGKYGTMVLLLALILGVVGFGMKYFIQYSMTK